MDKIHYDPNRTWRISQSEIGSMNWVSRRRFSRVYGANFVNKFFWLFVDIAIFTGQIPIRTRLSSKLLKLHLSQPEQWTPNVSYLSCPIKPNRDKSAEAGLNWPELVRTGSPESNWSTRILPSTRVFDSSWVELSQKSSQSVYPKPSQLSKPWVFSTCIYVSGGWATLREPARTSTWLGQCGQALGLRCHFESKFCVHFPPDVFLH